MFRSQMTALKAVWCRRMRLPLVLGFLCSTLASPASAADMVEAVTFDVVKGQLYVPLEEAIKSLHWSMARGDKMVFLGPNKFPLAVRLIRRLIGGPELVSIDDLQKAGAEVVLPPAEGPITVHNGPSAFNVTKVAKRVEVDLTKQQLSAWEGNRLVLQTHISSGRYRNSTPVGEFTAGPYKAEMHHSKKYNNAPMPWSVQLSGHVFIHGFSSVPKYPASHGCIRMPLDGGNPAKFFYEWVDPGTVVSVIRS